MERFQLAGQQQGWLPPRPPLTAANVLPPPSLRPGMTHLQCVLRGRQTLLPILNLRFDKNYLNATRSPGRFVQWEKEIRETLEKLE